MRALRLARTELVEIESYFHERGEAATASEWWPRHCLAFTTIGTWQVRSRAGRGLVSPDRMLVGSAATEYLCEHPAGLEDRAWCVTFREEAEAPAALLLPLGPRLHAIRRALLGVRWSASRRTATSLSCARRTLRACWPGPRPRWPRSVTGADSAA
jgi:hypothetical protein